MHVDSRSWTGHEIRMNKPKSTSADKIREQLQRLLMTSLDFRHALSAATFLAEESEWGRRHSIEALRRLKCYETTMVVAYSRPFAQSRGHTAPFQWSLLGRKFALKSDEAALHEKMIELRNKLHAHSDGDFTRVVPEIWRSRMPDGKDFDFLAAQGGENLNFAEDEVQAIHKFLWKIRQFVDDAIQTHPAPRDAIPVRLIRSFGTKP